MINKPDSIRETVCRLLFCTEYGWKSLRLSSRILCWRVLSEAIVAPDDVDWFCNNWTACSSNSCGVGSDVFPDMRSLHISLNTTHSGCKPSSSISSLTHSLQVFLPLPAHLTPATTTFLQADTQSSPLLRSTCPNHLNLPRLTTSATLWTLKRLYKIHTALSILQTPHTSISPSSVPSSPGFADLLSSSPRFQFHMYTLDTSLVYLSFYVVWCTPSCQ